MGERQATGGAARPTGECPLNARPKPGQHRDRRAVPGAPPGPPAGAGDITLRLQLRVEGTVAACCRRRWHWHARAWLGANGAGARDGAY